MELIEKIKKYLRDQFCVEYTGKLNLIVDVYTEEEEGLIVYTLKWPLNPDDPRPLILEGQFRNEDEFFEYIKKQIKTKRFFLYKNFRVIKVPYESENQIINENK